MPAWLYCHLHEVAVKCCVLTYPFIHVVYTYSGMCHFNSVRAKLILMPLANINGLPNLAWLVQKPIATGIAYYGCSSYFCANSKTHSNSINIT